ncbi:MAG: hypothetical protein HYY16_04970 [Planctomycetes bacterium]|nr:hypothetical protein [Planctomycetota bacterium]
MHTITVVLMALSLLQEEEGWKAKEVKPYLDNGRPSPEQALIFLGTPQDFEKRLEARQSGDAREVDTLPPPKPGPDLSLYIVVGADCQEVPFYQIKVNERDRKIRVYFTYRDQGVGHQKGAKIQEKTSRPRCKCHFVLGSGMSELTAGEYEIEIIQKYYEKVEITDLPPPVPTEKETLIRKERVRLAE